MNNVLLFTALGYIQVLLQTVIVFNIAQVPWTSKRLIFTMTAIYVPHVLIFNNVLRISLISWILLTFLVFWLSFKQSWQKSAWIALTIYLINFVLQSTIVFIINHLPEGIQSYIFDNVYITRVFNTAMFIFAFVYTSRFRYKGYSTVDYLISKHALFYMVFYVVFLTYQMFHHDVDLRYINVLSEAFVAVLFLVLFISSVLYAKADQHLKNVQQELISQKLSAESQEKTLEDLRGFKHDYRNIHETMRGLLEVGEIEKLKLYMAELDDKFMLSKINKLPEQARKIPILYGILVGKISRAELKEVKLDIDIMEDNINLKYCTDLDYSRIISNLLDNAVEAADISVNKIIKFTIETKNGKLVNVITNSCDTDVDIHRIFDLGYSTKPDSNGEGLHQVRLIQEKYKKRGYSMEINTTYQDGYFTQVVII